MGSNSNLTGEKGSHGRLILPSLVVSRCVTALPLIVTGLLMIEIGETFGVPVGISGQIRTASSILSIVFGLIMGALSVRFKHKSLLMTGLLIYSVSALSCGLSPNFNIMLILYSLVGLGFAMVTPMTTTLVGEHLPLEKRGEAIGWTIAGMSLIYLFGTQITNFITGLRGWRWAFLGFVLPISLLSFLLVTFNIPSKSRTLQFMMKKGKYTEGFKEVFSNKSAVACLVGTSLSIATWNFMLIYGASFWRQRFLVSRGFVSVSIIGTSLSYTLGSLVCGRFVNRFGRKPITGFSVFLVGVLTVSAANVPNIWLSMAFGMATSLFAGIMITAFTSLTLEQVPKFRGTMMSLSSVATSMGQAIGGSVGGVLLLLFNYGVLGFALGCLGIIAALVFYLFAIDPTITLS